MDTDWMGQGQSEGPQTPHHHRVTGFGCSLPSGQVSTTTSSQALGDGKCQTQMRTNTGLLGNAAAMVTPSQLTARTPTVTGSEDPMVP